MYTRRRGPQGLVAPAASVVLQDGHRVLDGVVYDVLDLQLVLVVAVVVGQSAELVHQAQTLGHALRRHEVAGHFDAVVQIPHLRTDDGQAVM